MVYIDIVSHLAHDVKYFFKTFPKGGIIIELFSLFATIGLKDDGFQTGVKNSESGFEKLKTAATTFLTVAIKALAAVGAAAVGFGVAAVNVGKEYESEIANLSAITGMTTTEMANVEEGIRKIALESGVSFKELASNAKMVAEAGGDVDLMMAQLAHGTNLATATQSDLATTLDFVGSQMKTFGIEAEDTQGVVDSFALVTTLANVELSQLGESYVNCGGSAAQAGLSIDDVNSVLVTFSNAGLKGGAAGTALNSVLKNLSSPTSSASAALDELNIALYDSEGASRDVFHVMEDLESAFASLTDEERNHYAATIFDSVALKGWNMIAAEGMDEIIGLSAELTNAVDEFDGLGQSVGMAAIQSDTFNGRLGLLKTSAEGLGISFYKSVQEPLKALAGVAIDVVQSLTSAFEAGSFDIFIEKLKTVFSSFFSVVTSVGDVILTKFVPAIQKIADNINIIIPILTTFMGLWAGVQLLSFIGQAGSVVKALNLITLSILGSNAAKAKDLIETTALTLMYAKDAIARGVSTASIIAGTVATTASTVASKAAAAAQWLLNAALNANPISLVIIALVALGAALVTLWNTNEDFRKGLIAAWEAIVKFFTEIPEKIWDAIVSAKEKISTWGNQLVEIGKEKINALIETISNLASTIPQKMWDAIYTAIDRLIEWGNRLITIGKEKITSLVETIKTVASQVPQKLYDAIKGAIDKVVEWGKYLVEKGKQAITDMINGIVSTAASMASAILQIGTNIVEGVWKGIQDAADWFYRQIKNFFSDLIDSAKDALGIKSPSRVFAEIGKFTAEGFIQGLESMSGEVDSAVSDMFSLGTNTDFTFGVSGSGAVAFGAEVAKNGGITINQTIQSVDKTPYQNEQAAAAAFQQASWGWA